MTRVVTLAVALLTWAAPVFAERAIRFTTSRGTWMSVDVSPDGKTLVFDLIGDLYAVPVTGGTARRLTSGVAHDSQPRWSPDGRTIIFCSDRSGADNIWTIDGDGANAQAVTTDADGGITAPAWTPDGEYVIARKDPTYNRRGSAELWLYPRAGGSGIRLTRRQDEGGLNPNGPVASPDGRWVYFAHGYRVLDSTWGPWQIWRLDRREGGLTPITSGYHGAVKPTLTRDGTRLLYIRRDHAQSALVVREVASGVERDLARGLDRDDQRGTTDYDAYPGFSVTPDNAAVIIAKGGELRRIALADGADTVIPFTADVSFDIADPARARYRIPDDAVSARVIRSPTFTTDGGTVVFEAFGKIWAQTGAAAARRLTTATHREYTPAVSPDGKWVAFVSWDDRERGQLWKAPISGGKPQQITTVARQYANPAWSPDGSKIALSWRAPNYGNTANVAEDDPAHEIVWISAAGGPTTSVVSVRPRNAGRWFPAPRFGADNDRVFYVAASSDTRNDLYSIALDGSGRRSHLRFKYIEDAAPSPDGKRVAFVSMDDLYVTDMPLAASEPIEVDLERPAVPLQTVTRDGGSYPSWTSGGATLTWSYANVAYRMGRGDQTPAATTIELKAPRGIPAGQLVLRGARIVTMRGDEVIERGDIVVAKNRITAIGPAGEVTAPPGATIVDVTGKTIIPGLVDAHWHGHYNGQEIFAQQKWQYLADLAYGVTTGREVSAPTRDTIAQGDLVESGDMVGPRVFGTGWPLFPGREGGPNQVVSITTLDDARRHVRRLKRAGVTYLKQYLQPRRQQRQWLQQAAREEGLMITAEGGGLKVQTSMILDGYTGFEHGIPVAPIYDDMIQLLAKAGTVYTPTFVAGYAKPGSMDYYYARENVHDDPRAARFTPHDLLDRFTGIRVLIPDDHYLFRRAAESAYKLYQAGGKLAVGGHGNHPGLGPHWELWSFVDGGMPPADALRLATLGGAECLGIEQDAGSLEVGKLADMVVLNADPREDIHHSKNVFRVVKNGRVFDPDELAALLPWALK